MDVDKLIQHIPNNVSGDGKPFVAALKKALIKYKEDLNKKIDDNTSSAGEKPGHVSSVQLLELHSINDGVRINSIQVSWVKTTVTNYAKAEVWFRTATDKAWEKAGESSGTQFVYSGATTGLTYYIKVVAVNTKGNTADFDTAPQASIKIQGSQYIPNPPTQFVLTWDEKGPLWKWLFEPNEYIDFFELRLDQNPGVWNDKRLDSTRETWSRANPGVRSGTAYLYIRNIFGEYSEPAVHEFSKALPQKPTAPQLTSTIDGVRIKMQGLPLGATGYKIHIKTKDSKETVEDDFYTVNSEYIYFFFIGHITVKYCFVDPLGDGEWSDTSEADCKAGIDIGQVPTIDYTKFDKFTQDAINKANNQPSINDALKNLITDNTTAINEAKKLITNNTTAINEANKLIDANANGIHQNTDSISSVMTKVKGLNEKVEGVEGTVTTQGTAIVQTATDITVLAKRVTVNEGVIGANTSSIQQNADSIASVVKRVDDAEGTLKTHGTAIKQNADSIVTIAMDVKGNTSSIQQNADSITSVVKRVDTAEGTLKTQGTAIQQNANSISTIAMDVKGNASAIEQNAKSITAIVEDVKGNKASIQTNADNITSIVTKVDKQGSTIDKQGSAIVQNANSITSVVTELNKKPADCNYSSINQLQDDILLCVKKDGVINAINVSTEGIVIDGNKVHITGDTVFDNNVIVGGMIAADSIALEHLKANSVSSAKIQANAITSTKIAAGAVTADKIEAGAITAEKLAADSVTSGAIQAGSVIGDKIAANTITGKHFAAANIDLTGALTITGGNVKLSQEGLRLSSNDGSFTLFNQEGINYIDAHGITYAQVKKMIIGKAYDGQYIRFAAPWPTPPSVLMSPMTIKINDESYPAATFYLVCEATDVTENGFKVNNYLRLDEGSYGVNNDERTDNTSIYNVLKMEQYWYGHYSYSYDFKVSSDVMDVTFPETANYIELSLVLDIKNPLAHYEHGNEDNGSSGGYVNGSVNIDYPNANRGHTSYDNSKRTITAQLYIGETKLSEATFTVTSSLPSEKKNFVLSGRFETGQTRAFIRIIWNMKLNTGEHGSWETLYNGRNDIARACCAASVTKAYHKYSATTSKIARGYAMFLVTDGSTNTYTAEVTVQVLINYDGKPLAATTITVDGVEYTTNLNGIIEMSGNGSKEHTFAYGTAPTTKAVVNYTDGVVTTIGIQPASITCYLRILYDGKSVANDTVTVNGEAKATDADGKIAIGGIDKHTGDYVVAYGNDSTKITVTYVANGVTNVALYSIVEGSKVFTTEDNGTETFAVPAGITKLLLTATVNNADVPPGEEVQYSCSVTNTANNTVWGYGEAYSFIEDDGETEHTDMRSVVEVTPRKEYTLKFVGATINDTVDGIKFEWSKTINAMTANIVDK